jgi:uncharacterized protein
MRYGLKLGHATIVVSLLLFGTAELASAGEYEDALAANRRGDAATGSRLFRLAAEHGDPRAQRSLAFEYEGSGNLVAAAMWLQRAAEQGDGQAQWHLGARYEGGRGVRQDYTEAARWYRKAAEQGFELAYANLGQMYYEGRGVTQDYAEALKWFSRAADLGDADGQYFLGWMYFNGQGVSPDYVQAYTWLNLAAAHVIVLEEKERDDYVHKRDMVASKMTPAQIAESQRLAREWKPKWER